MKNSPIQIIYVSASGNTLSVVEFISNQLKDAALTTQIKRVEHFNPDIDFNKDELYIFATSTWVHGEINPYFQKTLQYFEKNPTNNFKAAFIGTGDLRYDPILFCNGMEIIRKAYLDSGGKEITDPLKINGDPHDYFDSVISNWGVKLISELQHLDK